MRNRSWIVMSLALTLAARAAETPEQIPAIPAPPPAPALEPPPATLETPAEEPSPLLIPETPAPAPAVTNPVAAPKVIPPAATTPAPSKPKPSPPAATSVSVPLSGGAVVKEDRVNVRSRPVATSEVIAQLNHGDRVEVLEQIKVDNPKPGEPAAWTKIALPKTNTVWISSKYVDPATHTVSASRLNVRAGPGENHGV